MKKVILSLLFLFSGLLGLAQINNDRSYKKAKVYLNDHRILKANNLRLNNTDAAFLNTVNNKQEVLALDNIKLIKKAKGSHILEGALYGAGTLALTALIIDIQPDDPQNLGIERDHGLGFYLGLTGGGAALGALIGSFFPKWKTVYSGGKFIGLDFPIKIDFTSESNLANIKITVSI